MIFRSWLTPEIDFLRFFIITSYVIAATCIAISIGLAVYYYRFLPDAEASSLAVKGDS